ncbi:methyltransferase type 12 [Flexivirga endophytica]|uniref:Methyltransferase type 12 n=1 Tax=Flexivirga endophytica TaxID=1849103 RepID=A0A916WTI1_9MICO|nr:methyltransferase domain-containing protein [Flexivirga endophytica]GGB28384.1 methyltransferase type 12 [Flexivirga endophytica]GHB62114.1 methyltransferase type 12 [Flexivirga endophytica]
MSDEEQIPECAINAAGGSEWYERLYAEACDGSVAVPWDHGEPTPYLVTWLRERFPKGIGSGRSVLIGAAYGDDAELVASYGFDVVGFDVSAAAVAAARARHPDSVVDYRLADLLDLPVGWRQAFDLVVECTTLQSMPQALHMRGAAGAASLCAEGGEVLVIARCPGVDDPPGPPFLLPRGEVESVAVGGVRLMRLRRIPMRGGDRWVGEFTRPADC